MLREGNLALRQMSLAMLATFVFGPHAEPVAAQEELAPREVLAAGAPGAVYESQAVPLHAIDGRLRSAVWRRPTLAEGGDAAPPAPANVRGGWTPPRGVSLVEFPRDSVPGFGPPQRPHHGLSIGSERLVNAARAVGLQPTECATQFRMPTKVRVQPSLNSGGRLDFQAQLRFNCHF